mgnify:CR=1 FL=1
MQTYKGNVRVYDNGQTLVGVRDIRDLFGDDDDGLRAAEAELLKIGRAWIGGGAAPLVMITAVKE